MAKLVLGIGTSHTPMLMALAEDWPRFIDRDGVREFLDKEGHPATYEELLRQAEPHVAAELTPERFAARHSQAQAGVDHLKSAVRRAELDALIVVGDDHKELYQDDNLPSFVVYHGATIRNVSRGVIGVSALQALLAGIGVESPRDITSGRSRLSESATGAK